MSTLADLSQLPPIPTQRGGDPMMLRDELLHVIRTTIADNPRSQQKRIGPSEIGSPCQRRIGYKLAGVEPVNDSTAWRPTVGTAVHTWLEDAFLAANRRWRETTGEDVTRYLLEHKVDVGDILGQPITGRCDLYDRVTATSVDWKIVGQATLRRVNAGHIDVKYRAQGHMYGRGWTRRGMPVDTVAVFFLPSAGELSQAVFWHEPYDEQIATGALANASTVQAALTLAGPGGALPVLSTADDHCDFCPYMLPASTELGEACPGHREPDAHTTTAA